MNHQIKIFVMTLALLFAICAKAEDINSIEVEVNGLVCAFCAQGITSAFSKEPQTHDVLVSLEHRLVAIELKPGTDMANDRVNQVLVDAGYDVVGIERTQRSLAMIRQGMDGESDATMNHAHEPHHD